MTDEKIYEIILADCKRVPLLANKINFITDFTIRRAPNVYECYHKNFNVFAESVLDYITEEIHNTVTIGRRGMFLQGDMHQSVEMGIEMGKKLPNLISINKQEELKIMKKNYLSNYARYIDLV